jgi:hypothetical protein
MSGMTFSREIDADADVLLKLDKQDIFIGFLKKLPTYPEF